MHHILDSGLKLPEDVCIACCNRWDGHVVQYETQARNECTKEEIKALNTAMWGVLAEVKDLIAPCADVDYKPLTGEVRGEACSL